MKSALMMMSAVVRWFGLGRSKICEDVNYDMIGGNSKGRQARDIRTSFRDAAFGRFESGRCGKRVLYRCIHIAVQHTAKSAR